MKRFLLIILPVILLSSFALIKSSSKKDSKIISDIKNTKKIIDAEVLEAKVDNKIKAVSVDGSFPFDVSKVKDLEFNLIILKNAGVRIPSSPYKTDYKALKSLEKNIKEIEKVNMNYIIDVTSGPGFSSDGNISSIFTNDTEALYFSKMLCEIIKRHSNSKYFKGIMLDLENTNVLEENYYNTTKYIIEKVQKNYPDVKILLSLYPLSFENNFQNILVPKLSNVTLNGVVYFKGMSYPGYAAGYKTSLKLNKNILLSNLQTFKEFSDRNNYDMIITVKIPWTEKSDILLQDIFEISKMLHLNINIYNINSLDDYDFSQNKDVLKIIERNNK
ncbi:hypothetical protein FDN13_06770 [Caloramator sp. E03]|uniref:hypothetical protein n=1 Tax=Caloramator sp. E03 TaxID=2576307 RepID=UPI0011104578|nr:hypothetical protein [Caloramator sp. E03]QCX33438.1 hypothetical protein FDN13_06770 [Caloramator sp. E03]